MHLRYYTDEKNDKLLGVSLSRTNAERQSIVHNYQKLFNKSILNEIQDADLQSVRLFLQDLLTEASMLLAVELNKTTTMLDLQSVTSILIDFWGDEFNQTFCFCYLDANKSIWRHTNNSFGVTVKHILQCTVGRRKRELKIDGSISGRGVKPIVNTVLVTKIRHIITRKLVSKEDISQSSSGRFCLLNPFELKMLNKQFKEVNVFVECFHYVYFNQHITTVLFKLRCDW
ncbi:hypothetical protein MN116_008067 [Schistosoma mekongi]|uniref:Uncharacterized protein n=1 Tax=Schistosoma mekongi TaxID=38744 RepID=A0AAE2D2E1_SCHME|nr:hypothetical protein MN116_008067 [Schistosoma mekongi]